MYLDLLSSFMQNRKPNDNGTSGLFETDADTTLTSRTDRTRNWSIWRPIDFKSSSSSTFSYLLLQLDSLRLSQRLIFIKWFGHKTFPVTIGVSAKLCLNGGVSNKIYPDVFFHAPLDISQKNIRLKIPWETLTTWASRLNKRLSRSWVGGRLELGQIETVEAHFSAVEGWKRKHVNWDTLDRLRNRYKPDLCGFRRGSGGYRERGWCRGSKVYRNRSCCWDSDVYQLMKIETWFDSTGSSPRPQSIFCRSLLEVGEIWDLLHRPAARLYTFIGFLTLRTLIDSIKFHNVFSYYAKFLPHSLAKAIRYRPLQRYRRMISSSDGNKS